MIVTESNAPFCLIGGWAVYFLVNENYRANYGRNYIGSRDIDIGLPDYDSFRLIESFLMKKMSFEQLSFRYVKYLNYDTGEEITSEIARKIPLHMLIQLYVDAMIPQYRDDVKKELGFIPPDEPLLEKVFADPIYRRIVNIANNMVMVPSPEILIAMKLNSIVNRTKDHKKRKDICDIISLSIFSDGKRKKLTWNAIELSDLENRKKLPATVLKEDIIQAANIINVPSDIITRIMNSFI